MNDQENVEGNAGNVPENVEYQTRIGGRVDDEPVIPPDFVLDFE